MPQFDVYRLTGRSILLLDCQNEYLGHLTTRFVVPLIPVGNAPPQATRLNPLLSIDGEDFILSPNAAATIRLKDMGQCIGSLGSAQDMIKAAIDQLITGF